MTMTAEELARENESLRNRLEEAEETLNAIRSGHVDAFVMSGAESAQVFTLESADRPYRLFVEEMQQGALTITFDGLICYGNTRFASIVGVPLETLIGSPVQSFVTASSRSEFDAILGEGRSGKGQGEVNLRRNDGVSLPAYLGVNALGGEAVLCVIVTDLTELKRTGQLQELAEISTRLTSVTDFKSVVGVLTVEARNLIGAHQSVASVAADAKGKGGVSTASFSEKYGEWTALEGRSDGDGISALALRTNEAVRLTHEELERLPQWAAYVEAAPKRVPLRGWLSAPLVGRDGRSVGLVRLSDRYEGEFTEDDEAVLVQLARVASVALQNARLYEELRYNDERKNEFLAMLAHELRNPLSAIAHAVKLASRVDAKDHLEWSMDVIARQMKHLSRLIDDLMDVSRITRGKIELKREVLEATPILESAAATVVTLVEERKHTLELDIERGNLWVSVDPTRLEQVVVNLLNNAAKYSENGGHILLSGRVEGGEVVIGVRDRGVGIPPDKLPEMFELFAQGDRSLARSEGGLGIGLTVVKKLVEMHGGTISAASEGIGKGSQFAIRLGLASAKVKRPFPRAASGDAPAKRVRILVVDDNVDTARGMAKLLRLIGHEVATAYSGTEGIEAARGFAPEFVLLDIGLPGMSGYDVAKQLRQEESCKDAVIIAISGYGQDEDRRRSKDAGFDLHLTKPLDHDALMVFLAAGEIGRR